MLRRLAIVALVVLATLGAGLIALTSYSADRRLSIGEIRLSVDPGHRGALDIYVPLLDWGARFDAVRLPARLQIDLRTVDRAAVARLAGGEELDVDMVRDDADDAVASYIVRLLVLVLAAALAGGGLVALAVRGRLRPRLGVTLAVAALTAVAGTAMVYLLLPPRGSIDNPEYYANGPDLPLALRVERATESSRTLSEELNSQLVGLARLVSLPAERQGLDPLPRLTVASDLHDNLLAVPTLERAAARGPILFAGDLTNSGTPLEARLARRIVRIGRPFVFVSGNHDSDVLLRRLARDGAIVLTERGRVLADGRLGEVVVRVGDLRVAGYGDPFLRRRDDDYRARGEPNATESQRAAFGDWLRPLIGGVDVVMVHSPGLARDAVEMLRADPPEAPIAIVTGHTHRQALQTSENLVELNGGTVGGGNLDADQPFGVAVLTYRAGSPFRPVAADLVQIDPRTGSARAQRTRLDTALEGGTVRSPPPPGG